MIFFYALQTIIIGFWIRRPPINYPSVSMIFFCEGGCIVTFPAKIEIEGVFFITDARFQAFFMPMKRG